jgi:hypothetical protein
MVGAPVSAGSPSGGFDWTYVVIGAGAGVSSWGPLEWLGGDGPRSARLSQSRASRSARRCQSGLT